MGISLDPKMSSYRGPQFQSSELKIERAREHMRDFEEYALKKFGSEFAPYSWAYNSHPQTGETVQEFSFIDEIKNRFALICGDAVHNLRTALDLAWYELTSSDTPPKDRNRLKFPIYPTAKHLEDFIRSREKQKSISDLSRKLLDVIKPYKGSGVIGDGLYHLHQVDMIDKHRLVIPQVQVSHVWHEGAQNSTDENVIYNDIINTYGTKVKDQGDLSAAVIFGEGLPVEGKAVLPTLKWFETAVKVTLLFLQ
jgi:hypothetical protein